MYYLALVLTYTRRVLHPLGVIGLELSPPEVENVKVCEPKEPQRYLNVDAHCQKAVRTGVGC